MTNFVYLIPVRNRGKGAHGRFECFLRLDDANYMRQGAPVKGDVVDEYQAVESEGFELDREFVKQAYRAIPDDNGRLVAVIPERKAA